MMQAMGKRWCTHDELGAAVGRIVATTPVYDIHTHLYDPKFGGLLLWGIDELLTYHYLIAETLRYAPVAYADFWRLSKAQQADLVWQTLFVDRTPLSEACRGVVTTLSLLGLDPRVNELTPLRRWFAAQKPAAFVGQCLEIAKLRVVCMTNCGWRG
jgi:hypothetical protein